MVLWTLSLAWADCPDPQVALGRAEDDIIAFYLNDAQGSLSDAVASLGCGEPVTPALAGRYWLAQAIIYHFQDDPLAKVAFQAARRTDAAIFLDAWGPDALAAYEAAGVPSGDPVVLSLRHRGSTDVVLLDGVEVAGELTVVPGMHLLQVRGAQGMRFATAFTAESKVPLTIDVGEATEAMVDPDGPTASRRPPIVFGPPHLDPAGNVVQWSTIRPLALRQPAGARASRRLGVGSIGLHAGAAALVAGGSYFSYLWIWDATEGKNTEPGVSGTLATVGGLVAASGLALEVSYLLGRKKHRRAMVDAANQTLEAR